MLLALLAGWLAVLSPCLLQLRVYCTLLFVARFGLIDKNGNELRYQTLSLQINQGQPLRLASVRQSSRFSAELSCSCPRCERRHGCERSP